MTAICLSFVMNFASDGSSVPKFSADPNWPREILRGDSLLREGNENDPKSLSLSFWTADHVFLKVVRTGGSFRSAIFFEFQLIVTWHLISHFECACASIGSANAHWKYLAVGY
jgi:hypothetical protein